MIRRVVGQLDAARRDMVDALDAVPGDRRRAGHRARARTARQPRRGDGRVRRSARTARGVPRHPTPDRRLARHRAGTGQPGQPGRRRGRSGQRAGPPRGECRGVPPAGRHVGLRRGPRQPRQPRHRRGGSAPRSATARGEPGGRPHRPSSPLAGLGTRPAGRRHAARRPSGTGRRDAERGARDLQAARRPPG